MTRSDELYARALKVLPGGVNSPVRAMRSIGRDPLFIAKAQGPEIFDVDGKAYIDYVCSWGPMILGHADRDVVAAIESATELGTSYGAPTEVEVQLAEEIAARIPSVDMVRMTSSGTEAGMSVLRLARAATDREKILKFAGAYHGHSDSLLVDAGSGLATLAVPGSPGVTTGSSKDTIVVPWNDRDAVAAACAEHEFAAIIAEPLPANMGLVKPAKGFLTFLRTQADSNGALLILDEVISGFRVSSGGYQELTGLHPDLTMLGKIVGGGLPAAAYAGRRDLMEMISPAGDVYQAGTLSGNPLAMTAGLATLAKLDDQAYSVLALRTNDLVKGFESAAEEAGVEVSVAAECGLITIFFAPEPPANYEEAKACNLEKHAAWCRALLDRGVYAPPSQFEAWFPSLVHDDAVIERTIAAAREAFIEIAA